MNKNHMTSNIKAVTVNKKNIVFLGFEQFINDEVI